MFYEPQVRLPETCADLYRSIHVPESFADAAESKHALLVQQVVI